MAWTGTHLDALQFVDADLKDVPISKLDSRDEIKTLVERLRTRIAIRRTARSRSIEFASSSKRSRFEQAVTSPGGILCLMLEIARLSQSIRVRR